MFRLARISQNTISSHSSIRLQLKRYANTKQFDHTTCKPSTYNPTEVEKNWYTKWEEAKIFKPNISKDIDPSNVFCIPAPPPNVTGALHIGHALTISLQDSLIRYNRMSGKTVLFLPGFDHAGIATQSVVEKRLWKAEGKTRYDYGRDKFTQKVWEWKDLYEKKIKDQIKKMGGSYDWSREAFTLDPELSKAVTEAFVRLHDEGIIYRDSKLVNWCVKLNTTISNLEVENKEIKGKTLLNVPSYDNMIEFGVLTSIAYPVIGSDQKPTGEKLVVSTTRPETVFGDTAIAIHPDDTRYTHLHGKFVKHPLLSKNIPIILDRDVVDMEFGTGAVKITPAHDENDYQCGKRNKLDSITIFTDDGCLNDNCGPDWKGMKRFNARAKVVSELKSKNLFVSEEDHTMTIPICSRSGDIIEPLLKPQWWIKQDDIVQEAIEVVKNGKIIIQPKHSKEEYFRWLNNIQDWCISRQLWWGHRCPVYFVNIEGRNAEIDRSNGKYWIAARDMKEAKSKSRITFPNSSFTLEQDTDVLDTWFSSALWPFSTLGWPEKTKDMEVFYPFSMLETGWDILFFWVARMIILGTKLTGTVPFREVFCHPLIRDSKGRKMSKSLGNVIDPLDVINGATLEELEQRLLKGNLDPKEISNATKDIRESYPKGIPECGTDALRFALCSYTSNDNANDINLDITKVENFRKFCNKLYQATNFAVMNLKEDLIYDSQIEILQDQSNCEKYMIHKLNICAQQVGNAFERRDFLAVTENLYQFWYSTCDIYIEYFKYISRNGDEEKIRLAEKTLVNILDQGLRMIHPMMPFISEELWQKLPVKKDVETICLAKYPTFNENINEQSAKNFTDFQQILSSIKESRSLLNQYNILKSGQLFVEVEDPNLLQVFKTEQNYIFNSIKTGIDSFNICGKENIDTIPFGCVTKALNSDIKLHLLIKGQVRDIEGDIKRLQKKITKLTRKYESLFKMIHSNNYAKVNESVRVSNQSAINDIASQISSFKMTIDNLQKNM